MTAAWLRAAAALSSAVGGWVAVVVVLTWIAVGLHLHDERAHALAAAQSNGANLARTFTESLLRGVRELDLTLLFVRALREREGPSADLSLWFDQVDRLHLVNLRIGITDRNGLATLSDLRPLAKPIDLSDRAYFRFLAAHPEDVLFVSSPMIGRIQPRWAMPFARRLRDPQGGFDGVLFLSVPPDSLLRFAIPVDLGRHGAVTVLGLDGMLCAEMVEGVTRTVAGTASASPAPRRAAAEESGFFRWTDPADGVTRLESFRRVAGLPLVVSVGLAEDAVLANYQTDLPWLLGVEAVVTVLLVSLAVAGGRERRQRAVAQAALERTLGCISQGITMVDAADRVLVMNRRFVELLGLPPEFGPGSRIGDILRWQMAHGENVFPPQRPSTVGESPSVCKRTRPNGTVLEIRSHLLEDGCAVRTFTDVTEWERTQQVLELAREGAEAASRARAQFLAVMSHEIRTPLNGILGIADLLGDTGLNPEQKAYARTIQDCGRHLLHLLNDVLDFARIDDGTLELECAPFAPRAVLEMVGTMVAPQAAEQGLRLSIEASAAVPVRVLGDAHRLRQVLLNLVGNALKFTPSGEVTVFLDAVPVGAGWRLDGVVRDTGIGIEPDMLARLFREFSQLDGSATRRFGGTGLGLAICRRLLEAMGGGIAAESRPGAGSTFRFNLVVGSAPAEEAAPAWPPVIAGPLRVLVAEDNRVNQLVATRILERAGHAVQAVEDGAAALAAARGGGFDLVLMDVMMPVMDGLTATRAIRELPGPAGRVKVIGLTASASRDDEAACRAAGMDGFAPKPITLERLNSEIFRVCGAAIPPAGASAAVARTDVGLTDAGLADTGAIDPTALAALDAALGAGTAAEIAAAFLADAPARLDRMRALAASGAAEQLGREAHALAGSAGTLGLQALAAAARSLKDGVAGGGVDLPACLVPLEAHADAAVAWLRPLAAQRVA